MRRRSGPGITSILASRQINYVATAGTDKVFNLDRAAANPNIVIGYKKTDLAHGWVRLIPSPGDSIDGLPEYDLVRKNHSVLLASDGVNEWRSLGTNRAGVEWGLTVIVIDGTTYTKNAAGINEAVATLGSGTAGVIFVPDAGDYSDHTIALGRKHVLQFGAGVFITAGILVPESLTSSDSACGIIGQGRDLTTLLLRSGANCDVITHMSFASLTGGQNQYGTFRTTVREITIDGDKANNGAGCGIRIYGRGFRFRNVSVQNCAEDGISFEWGGSFNEAGGASDDIQATLDDVTCMYNGGNGLTDRGPSDIDISILNSFGNGGWGVELFSSVHGSQWNTYTNGSSARGDNCGGIHVAISGALDGSSITGSTVYGFGILAEGNVLISASVCGGGMPIEIRGTGGFAYQGQVGNAGQFAEDSPRFGQSVPCFRINGGGNCLIEAMCFSFPKTSAWLEYAGPNSPNKVLIMGAGPVPVAVAGTPSGGDFVYVWAINPALQPIPFLQMPTGPGGGANTLPMLIKDLNGSMLFQTSGGDNWFQSMQANESSPRDLWFTGPSSTPLENIRFICNTFTAARRNTMFGGMIQLWTPDMGALKWTIQINPETFDLEFVNENGQLRYSIPHVPA